MVSGKKNEEKTKRGKNMRRRVGRISDFPLYLSPPIKYIYQQTVTLVAGLYTFALARADFTPLKNINNSTMLYIRHMSFSCNVPEDAYVDAMSTTMQFRTFLRGDASAPVFRNPLSLTKYDTFPWEQLINITKSNNRLRGNVNGVLTQNAALVGVLTITATIEMYVQEITDRKFIKAAMKDYPGENE